MSHAFLVAARLAVLSLLVMSPMGASAKSRVVRCFLSVDDKVYIDEACNFVPETDGSFSVGTTGDDGSKGLPFFAYVSKNEDGTAQGFWNEDASILKAQSDLGRLTRRGGCWQNARAKVCAQ